MKRKTQSSVEINDKIIYHAKTPMGWSIVIMPDNILIDNYPIESAHIHPNPEKHFIRENIKEQDSKKVLSIVLLHIELNKIVNIEKLKKELNGEL